MDLHRQVVAALFRRGEREIATSSAEEAPLPRANHWARASRFRFAHLLSDGTSFMGGPPSVPQAHGPSFLDSVMQEQDLLFRQAQT
jgi:hypothetical protein